MTKRFFSMGASVALLMGFVVGCQDSAVDATQSADPFAMYSVDETAMTSFSEVPEIDDALFSVMDGDSTDHDNDDDGGRDTVDRDHHGGRDTANHGGRDSLRDGGRRRGHGRDRGHGHAWGRLENRTYGRILGQLDLTADQTTAIEACFADYRTCARTAADAYRTARGERHDVLQDAIAQVRADLEAGTITEEEARAAVRELIGGYRTDIAALNDTFKAAVQSCQDALDTCIEGNLTAEQLVIWNRLRG
jgi:hypothetical protein